MHPRNRYRKEKPCFLKLALKYSDFRAHVTQDETGKAVLDFKNADALRALTTCLLKEDFGLTVQLPSNRLVPTLPLRLNYIHWIEDIIGMDKEIWGVDIGTGASCIYPLLASNLNKWHFLATEADQENAFHAQKNVKNNNVDDFIFVKPVSTGDILLGPLEDLPKGCPEKFDFCMCNPPFFADHMEAQAVTTSRSIDRAEPNSMSTASPEECISIGGEVGFIKQMIEESIILHERVRVYTSMVGKKSSLVKLKEELRHQKVTKFATTEFCQGKTMRWGIAWTFDSKVNFPKSEFESRKEKPPLQYIIPKQTGAVEYEVHALSSFLKEELAAIKVHVFQGKTAKSYTSLTLTAPENSWCHQRRQRRQQKKLLQDAASLITVSSLKNIETPNSDGIKKLQDSTEATTSEGLETQQEQADESISKDGQETPQDSAEENICSQKRSINEVDDIEVANSKKSKLDSNKNENNLSETVSESTNIELQNSNSETDVKNNTKQVELSDMSPKEFILKCVLRLKSVKDNINLEMEWLDGGNRELMHQLFTFLKNKLLRLSKV